MIYILQQIIKYNYKVTHNTSMNFVCNAKPFHMSFEIVFS